MIIEIYYPKSTKKERIILIVKNRIRTKCKYDQITENGLRLKVKENNNFNIFDNSIRLYVNDKIMNRLYFKLKIIKIKRFFIIKSILYCWIFSIY